MNETTGRPAPTPSRETAEFWQGCRDGRLLLQYCGDCGNCQYYYRWFCANCWSPSIEPFASGGQGRVWSFGVVHRGAPSGFQVLVPYVVAIVELEYGIKMITNIMDADHSELSIGTTVQLTFIEDELEYPVPVFRPSEI